MTVTPDTTDPNHPYAFQIAFNTPGTAHPVITVVNVGTGLGVDPTFDTTVVIKAVVPYSAELQLGQTVTYAAPDPVIELNTMPTTGTPQYAASIGMGPNGSYVVAWTQADQYTGFTGTSNDTIQFRAFNESTNTAGPTVSDFIQPDDARLQNGGEVTQSLSYLVRARFDQPMMTGGPGTANWAHSVINPANWALLVNGNDLAGGISQIYYGLNEGQAYAEETGALSSVPGDNKYEAVLVFNAKGLSSGAAAALGNGSYQIVALNSLANRAGNPLGRTGFLPNGSVYSRSFDIVLPTSVPSGSDSLITPATWRR